MKQTFLSFCVFFLVPLFLFSQTNIFSTNALAEKILLGNYNPADYAALQPTTRIPAVLAADIEARISPDSLKSYIFRLSQFGTRNTGSDTLSATKGIGASRRWVHQQFETFSAANSNRLVVSYLQFDTAICTVGRHRNIFAVLPGANPANNGVILVEGHIDSRCNVVCDTACLAEGVEDNATGTALVMELARVMAQYEFQHSIVFLVTIGEEQGLIGADAFADYVQQKEIPLRAVLNNDVIGGIICGQTSSAPSCPGLNNIDSTSVRLFSSGGFNSKHKQLARFIKLEYQENVFATTAVPMNVRIMSPEDRTGRGGDHIPFRKLNYAAMRFTSANEHGDASNGPNYTDRQHTAADVLGVDTDGNGTIDSFFVDFNYLTRNAVINANAAAVAARGVPAPPDFTATRSGSILTVNFNPPLDTNTVRVALRSTTNDWDTVYAVTGGASASFPCNPTGGLSVSLASVDYWQAESLFGVEKNVTTSATQEAVGTEDERNIRLFQNRPNPFDEATWISFWVENMPAYREAMVQISDMQGKVIERIPVKLQQGMNETLYTHGYGVRGTFVYTLLVDGAVVDGREMIFAN